jgi:predicted CXXCH cytochrome family protein
MARRRAPLLLASAGLAGALGCIHAAAPKPPPAPPKPIVQFTPVENPDPRRLAHPHGAGDKAMCQVCHEPGVAGVKKDPIALCAGCHDPARMKHPFRVEAPAHAAGKVPLMDGNVIACHTCHDPHDVRARRGGLRASFRDLCLACHTRHADDLKPTGHPAGAPKP